MYKYEYIKSMQRYCSSFYYLLIYLIATCFGRTTIFKQKIRMSEITLLTTDPLFSDINVMDDTTDRF
jgi:hypothetical protein